MENFNIIPNAGTYGSAIALINANFQLTKEQLERLAYSREGFCGMYETDDDLEAAYPHPTTGSFAYVGTSFPMTVYLATNGVWAASSSTYSGGEIDLNQYADKASLTALAGRVTALESAGYVFIGVATPNGVPTVATKSFALAWAAGTYTNYGGYTVNAGELAVLLYNGSAWSGIKTDIVAKGVVGGYDTTPTEDSEKPVTSGGVYEALDDLRDDVEEMLANADAEFGTGEKVSDTLIRLALGSRDDVLLTQKTVSNAIFNEININDIDDLNTLAYQLAPSDSRSLKPTFYTIVATRGALTYRVGSMAVFSDNLGHVVTEVMTTHYLLDASGNLTSSSSDSELFSIYRSVNPSVGTWTSWHYVNSNIWTSAINSIRTDLVNYYTKAQTYSKTEVDNLIAAVKQFKYRVVPSLPAPSINTMGEIYLVPAAQSATQNVKDEYITIWDGNLYKWEQIGSTAIDLSDYSTTAEMNTAINAAIASALISYYTKTQVDTLLDEKQDVIDDLSTIRSGAAAGATAVQPAAMNSAISSAVSTESAHIRASIGYYECSTAAATAAKVVSASSYTLANGGCIRIKMINANTANNVTLNINSTGAKALYYNGERASASNSWEAGEVLEVYYDGTQYQCASGGGGKFATGEDIKDVSITNEVSKGSNSLVKGDGIYYAIKDVTLKLTTMTEGKTEYTVGGSTNGQITFGFNRANRSKIRKIIFDIEMLSAIADSQGITEVSTGINIGTINNGRVTVSRVYDFVVDLSKAEQDVSSLGIFIEPNECMGVGNTSYKLYNLYGNSECFYMYNISSGKANIGQSTTSKYLHPSYIVEFDDYDYLNLNDEFENINDQLSDLSTTVDFNATTKDLLYTNKDLTISEFNCDTDYVYWCTTNGSVGDDLHLQEPQRRVNYRGLRLQVKGGGTVKFLVKPNADYFGRVVITDANFIVTNTFNAPNAGTEYTFASDGYLYVSYDYTKAADGQNTSVLSVPEYYYSNLALSQHVETELFDIRNYIDAKIDEITRAVGNGAVINFYSFKNDRADVGQQGWSWNSSGEYYTNTNYTTIDKMIGIDRPYAVEGRTFIFDFEAGTGSVYFGAGTKFDNNYGEGSLCSVDIDNGTVNIHQQAGNFSTIPAIVASSNLSKSVANVKIRAKYAWINGYHVVKIYDLVDNTLLGTTQKDAYLFTTRETTGAGGMLDRPIVFANTETKLYNITINMDAKSSNCYCYIGGDSITQGARLYEDYGYSYGQQMAAALPNLTIAIAGRSAGHFGSLLRRLDSEAAILKPKYIMICEGTNDHDNNSTEYTAYLQSFLTKCIEIGAEPIICHPPHRTKTSDNVLMSTLIDDFIASSSTYIRCVKMDVACSIDCDYSKGEDTSLFPDRVHPNKEGHTRMFERIRIDCPELFMF